MNEYRTLKEWFGDATRGDGRKFTRNGLGEDYWFEPIFLCNAEEWNGIDVDGAYECCPEYDVVWKEWHPTEQRKTLRQISLILDDQVLLKHVVDLEQTHAAVHLTKPLSDEEVSRLRTEDKIIGKKKLWLWAFLVPHGTWEYTGFFSAEPPTGNMVIKYIKLEHTMIEVDE